ncbi:MAG: hypothetical protein QME05_05640 [Candidatus Margulisbacteria bacterium]|nr:hypothetical protein [Candidatus Margulisiibacteriota bacterium]
MVKGSIEHILRETAVKKRVPAARERERVSFNKPDRKVMAGRIPKKKLVKEEIGEKDKKP